MNRLTPVQRKVAAIVVAVAAMLVLVIFIAGPWWYLSQRYGSAIDDAASRLERYVGIAGMRDSLQQKAVAVRGLEANRHFLKSTNPALAAAELQEQVKSILEANGGKLNSIQILPHKEDGPYQQISATLQLNAPLSAVKAMLYALESGRPYLFIDNLSIRVQNIGIARTDPNAEPDLFVQFDIVGFALKGSL